jgi:formate dehydrogenase major subunit
MLTRVPRRHGLPGYVGLIANGEYMEAAKLIRKILPLPSSIGRVCPHPCETACRRKLVEEPVAIAALKSFVGDIALESGSSYIPEPAPTPASVLP